MKQMTAKCPPPEGWVTHTSLLLFLLTLARNQNAPEIFKLRTLCNIVMKVEAYKFQNGLTQRYSWPHLGALQAASSLPVVWEWTSSSSSSS
jgi:hypothetical protein